jgi:hypothetical protein
MRAIIAVPILNQPSTILSYTAGWPESFEKHAGALTRQVSRFGNKTYTSSTVKTLVVPDEGLKFSKRVKLDRAVIISKGERISVLVAAFSVIGISDVLNLRRLSLAENRQLYMSELGLELDGETSVYGLAIVESNNSSMSCRDGLLVTETSESNFVFDVIYMQTLGALAFERELLEIATKVTFKPGFLNLRALSHLGELKHWLSYPSSDSSRLYKEVELLRESLKLDIRREQVLRSLEQHSKRLSHSITVFGVSLPVALAIAQTLNFSTGMNDILRILISTVVSFATGFISWKLSRN